MTSIIELTTIQEKYASPIDRMQVCSFQMEFVDNPTYPIIHSSARFLFFLEGSCLFTLNGIDYEVGKNTMIAIMPWDISVIKSVYQPLTFQKIVYNSNIINGYLRNLYNPKNTLIKLHESIIDSPIIHCSDEQTQLFQNYIKDRKSVV